jgi:hypothetical protein
MGKHRFFREKAGKTGKITGDDRYDNEYGYSKRMPELAQFIGGGRAGGLPHMPGLKGRMTLTWSDVGHPPILTGHEGFSLRMASRASTISGS